MSNDKRNSLALLSALAMMSNPGLIGNDPYILENPYCDLNSNPVPKRRTKTQPSKNWEKKCFRGGCNNTRSGNKLYCSSECCKLDKNK